jgi:predicted ATPase/transcriptional regulator with XRE-family HTH domain
MGTHFERADTTLSFGYWVRRQRRALDLTQKELARRAWCSVATIKKIETDQRRPSEPLAETLAECLSVPDDEREMFVQAARGNRAPGALSLSHEPVQDTAKHNLPQPGISFVGRDEELSAIGDLLEGPKARLLTLAGPGGVGKTKLAVQAAHLRVGAHEDGVWFVPLAGVGDVEYLPAAIAEVLGLQFAGRLEPAVQLRNFLRDKEVLLALDNFEQLLPDGLGLVLDLLQHAPGVTLLVTSRERLNVQQETVLSLQGLALEEGARLFRQRVSEADLLRLPPDIRASAERICRLVDGLPLGIEMAAAWTRLISPEELASELAEDLDLLVAASRDAPERHRSMRVVFEASWRRLEENERDVLRKLSVFRGGLTLEAAERVAGATMRSMADLVDRSLVQRLTLDRLGLHELIRHYAAEQLARDPEGERAARERHSTYYAAFLGRIKAQTIQGYKDTWLEDIEAEMDNVRAAWAWATDNGRPLVLLPAAEILSNFFDVRGRLWEGRAMLESAQRSLEGLPKERIAEHDRELLMAIVLDRQGLFASRLGEPDRARALTESALALFDRLDAPDERAAALNNLANQNLYVRNLEGALARATDAHELFESVGSLWGMAVSLNLRGLSLAGSGRPELARSELEQALSYWERLDNEQGVGRCLLHLGFAICALGDYAESRRIQQEALMRLEALKDTSFMPVSLTHLGYAHYFLGDHVAAGERFSEALQECMRYRLLPWAIYALSGLGLVAARQEKPEKAVTLLTFVTEHPLLLDAFTLGEPERVLEELSQELPEAAFTRARERGQTKNVDQIMLMLEGVRVRHQRQS